MSDDDLGYVKFRALLEFGLIFAGLFVYSFFDLVFLTIGREGSASVTEVYKQPARRGRYTWEMEFKFKDSTGNERNSKSIWVAAEALRPSGLNSRFNTCRCGCSTPPTPPAPNGPSTGSCSWRSYSSQPASASSRTALSVRPKSGVRPGSAGADRPG